MVVVVVVVVVSIGPMGFPPRVMHAAKYGRVSSLAHCTGVYLRSLVATSYACGFGVLVIHHVCGNGEPREQ